MSNLGHLSRRERYRLLVSLLIIPLGIIIVIRAGMVGAQAWMLIVLGVAFVGLGIVRLHSYVQNCGFGWTRRR
jgi:uncharacterized membrane protein YecN with MAPEG domain